MQKEHPDKDTITSREMAALELNAEYFGVSRLQLMENAGHQVASEIVSRFASDKSVAIFCGTGGNGGDGFVLARHLSSMSYRIALILAGKAKQISHEEALENWKALQFLRRRVPIYEVYDSSLIPEIEVDIVVDAILGTGAKGTLKPPILQLVEKMNAMDAFRVAVDVPTGIDADTGEVLGSAVKADLTITFHKPKLGLEYATGYVGELLVKDIGLPRDFENLAGPGDVLSLMKPRPSKSHKGDYGRLLVIGGDETYSGAPALVALAALRTGVDLAYVAAPKKAAYAISSMSPNLITMKLEGGHLSPGNLPALKACIETVDSVVLGPGLGLHTETKEFVEAAVEAICSAGKPLLLDADGLKSFVEFQKHLGTPLILTPHAGEYATLVGKNLSDDLDESVSSVQKTAADLEAVILLKGPVDIISDGRNFKLNFTGNPGMTAGGTGDVLSGIVGALLAQHTDPFEAAVAGAFVNGAAGDFVLKEKGCHMVSTDLLEWIPHVLSNPASHLKVREISARID